jgi:hypothetical protein
MLNASQSFDSHVEFKVALLPAGKHVPSEKFDKYTNLLCKYFSVIPKGNATAPGSYRYDNSPWGHFDWMVGDIRFNFVTSHEVMPPPQTRTPHTATFLKHLS